MEKITIHDNDYAVVKPDNGSLIVYLEDGDPLYNEKFLYIPEGIEGIAHYSFVNSSIEKILLPSTLRVIGTKAFRNCFDLKKLKLPNNLLKIGSNAFEHSRLEEITIPKSVINVYYGAFYDCEDLKYINIENPNIRIVENNVIDDYLTHTVFSKWAFYRCSPKKVMVGGKEAGVPILRKLVKGGMKLDNYDTDSSSEAIRQLKLKYEIGEL